MSDDSDLNKKYQEYYNQLLTGTLTDSLMKSITYQANIKLANDVIADNEKTINELQEQIQNLNELLNSEKSNKVASDNQKITILENSNKEYLTTIQKLNTTVSELTRYKNEYENARSQIQHLDTFRSELEKTTEKLKNVEEEHQRKVEELIKSHNLEVEKLNKKIEYLELTPAKRKKVDMELASKKTLIVKEEPKTVVTKAKIIKQSFPEVVIKKDGGSF